VRGFPPFQLIFVILGFLALAAALAAVTRPRSVVSETTAATEPAKQEMTARLLIRWAHQPEQVTITHEGRPWADLRGEALTLPCEISVTLPHPAHEQPNFIHSIECLVQARWPAGTPETALSLTLEPVGHEPAELTLWAQESVDEIVVFRSP
jgi:hypothetical protein